MPNGFNAMPEKMNNHQLNSYRKNQILSLNPLQLLIKVYDVAIIGCKARDMERVSKALVELISALRFEYGEIAQDLFRLYQFCLDNIKKEDYDAPLKILSDLRETWVTVSKQTTVLKQEEVRVG